jgi:predicted nuclease with TOPRIM domain
MPGATSRASGRGQSTRTKQRLEGVQSELERRTEELEDLEADLQDDIADLVDRWDEVAGKIEAMPVGLERDDLTVDEVALAWIPTP